MEGLEKFREAFEAYSENYVIIGGTACDIAMTGTVVRPRATIELLSRHPDILGDPKGLTIEPLPVDEDVSSLSAIIMDDDYYHFTINHSRLSNGIRHADSAALIALKARAYLNLLQDKASGKHVNSRDIKKHRSDVLKNVVIIEDDQIIAPASIVECVKEFVASIRGEWATLAEPLAKALEQDTTFVEGLLEVLDNLFIVEEA